MKRFQHLVLVLFVLSIPDVLAQPIFTGQLQDWSNGSSQILFVDLFSGVTSELGVVENDGSFAVSIQGSVPAWADSLGRQMLTSADDGVSLIENTVASSFQCNDEPVTYVNGDAVVIGIPDLVVGNVDKEQFLGFLYATSRPEIPAWLASWGMENLEKGYYLQWYHLETDASAHGECSVTASTGLEQYEKRMAVNLDLKSGWNIIKHEFAELFQDQNGNVYPSLEIVTTLDKLPDDVLWVLEGGEQE